MSSHFLRAQNLFAGLPIYPSICSMGQKEKKVASGNGNNPKSDLGSGDPKSDQEVALKIR